MYRAVARMLRGDVACLVAGAGILAFVVTTNAERLVHGTASVATPEVMESTVSGDRTGLPTLPDHTSRDPLLAFPRPHASGGANGGSASGGIAGPAATSQSSGFEVIEGFVLGFIGGQVGWDAFAVSTVEGHVDNVNPAAGDQHLRLARDPDIANNALIGAFSPNMGPFTNISAVVSVDMFLTGSGRTFEVIPQNSTEGLVVARVRFRSGTNIIDILDDPEGDGTFAFQVTGTTWIPDQYVNLTIDLNVLAGKIDIFYNAVLIYSIVAVGDFGSAVEEVLFNGTNGSALSDATADYDNYDVAGGPLPTGACCNDDGASGCSILSQPDCATAGGTYLGNDTLCVDCPMGACCNIDGNNGCAVITPEECSGIVDAFYFGDATLCVDCPFVPPTCGPGAGDCLVAHLGPGCDDLECCALVCDTLPFCCLEGFDWDAPCVLSALDTFCRPDPACGVPGTGDCIVGNGTPFCDDNCGKGIACAGCCELICTLDPYCCALPPFQIAGNWDGQCAIEAQELCGCEAVDVPPNDDCIDAIEVFVGPAIDVSTECGSPDGPSHATCTDGFSTGLGVDVWFIYHATFDGALTVTPTPLDPAVWLTQLAVYEGTECGALSDPPLACAEAGGAAVVDPVVNGNSYLIRLGASYLGPIGTGTLQLAAVPGSCLAAANDCLEAAGTAGCNDLTCCAVVCLINPACCEVVWDQACADAAQVNCAALPCAPLDLAGANVIEDETCGFDTNGGCNSDPAIFTEIVSGDVIHGVAWADLASRDTDWYRLTIDPAADVNMDGMVDVYYSVVSELPIVSFLIRDLDPTCGPGGTDPDLVATTAYGQSCACVNPGVGTVNITDAIYVFAGTGEITGTSIFDGFPCGVGPLIFGNNYLLSVDVVDNGAPSPQECGAKVNTCPWDCQAVPDGSVGVNDFLALLAQWNTVDTCDFDGGGVGVNDFLALLANWGACP